MPKLIEQPLQAWRLLSVQAGALAVAFGSLPAETQGAILAAVGVPVARVPVILGTLFLLGRMVKQGGEGAQAPAG